MGMGVAGMIITSKLIVLHLCWFYIPIIFPLLLVYTLLTTTNQYQFIFVQHRETTRPGRHPRVRQRRSARADPSFSRGCAGGAADGGGDVLPMGDLGREGRHRNKGAKEGRWSLNITYVEPLKIG